MTFKKPCDDCPLEGGTDPVADSIEAVLAEPDTRFVTDSSLAEEKALADGFHAA
jgi:hypothetical protein